MSKVFDLNKNDRHNKVLEMDYNKMKNYFKYIKKHRNDSLYMKNIYLEDKEFLDELLGGSHVENKILKKIKNPTQTGGWSLFNRTEKDKYDNISYDKYKVERDNLLKGIETVNNNKYCEIAFDNRYSNSCLLKSNDLDNIYSELVYYNENLTTKSHYWRILIYEFIEFLLCCNSFYNDPKFNYHIPKYIIPIMKLIYNKLEYIKEANIYINSILNNTPSLFIEEFFKLEKERKEYLKKFGNDAKNSEYYYNFLNRREELINKHGFGHILINKLLFKIRNNV